MMRIPVMLLILLPCLHAQEGPAVEARVPVAELREIWLHHLDRGIAQTNQAAETREWFCRARLRQQPDHPGAIEGLAELWYGEGELTLAAGAMHFAQTLGSTNLDSRISAVLTNHLSSIDKVETEEPFIQTRVEMLREEILKSRGYLNLAEYAAFEQQLRTIIRQSNDRKEALVTLVELYELHREPLFPTMLSHLLLVNDPGNLLMVERCLRGLQALGREDLVRGFIMSYATQRALDPELNRLMGSMCLARGQVDIALLFINRWSMQVPDNPMAWQLLGQSQLEKRKYEQALRSLMKAAKLPGHSPDVYILIARVAERKGDTSTMGLWLSRWRASRGDDALLEALQSSPFNRYPRLLKEIQ